MIYTHPRDIQRSVDKFAHCHGYDRFDIRAALCDMDGTLYDSMSRHAKAWYRLITELGIDCHEDEFYMYEGMTGAATIRLLFERAFETVPSDEETAALYHRKTEYFTQLPAPAPMPGAQHLIQSMLSSGIRPVLVTGSGQSTLINRLDNDFPGAFTPELRVTSHNVTHGKPHPEPYLKAMEMAHTGPCEAFALENAPLGVESAARAGVFTIAVATGPIPLADLDEAGAAIVFNSMPECDRLFPELLQCLNHFGRI